MSEEIVACTGCGKKFRIPDGAAPSGAFDCTACGNAVKYGVKIQAGGGGASRPKSRGARRARRPSKGGGGGRKAAAAPAAAGRGGGSKGPRGKRGDRARDRVDVPEKENKNLPIVVAIMGGLLVIGIGAAAIMNSRKPKVDPAAQEGPGGTSTGGVTADPNATTGTDPAAGATDPAAVDPDPAATTEPGTGTEPVAADPEPVEDSGIGEVKEDDGGEKQRDERYYWYLDDAQLFIQHESTADTTEEERAEMDRLVALVCDMSAAREAVVAEGVLTKKWGRKAIPSMLSTFEGQTWDTAEQQFSAFKVQQMLRTIVKADLPRNRDFMARFNPQMTVPPKDFKSAAKMWTCHWLGNLQHKEEFKDFEEEEE